MTRCVAIIQARLNSTRLPRKVLLPVGNNTILQLMNTNFFCVYSRAAIREVNHLEGDCLKVQKRQIFGAKKVSGIILSLCVPLVFKATVVVTKEVFGFLNNVNLL